jgi:GWxTD domain-containing protein
MRYLLVIIFIITSFNASEAKKLALDVDFASFRYDDQNNIWELYYSFPDTLLKYMPDDGSHLGRLHFSLTISSAIDIVADVDWVVENRVDSPPRKLNMKMYGQKSFVIRAGQYEAELEVYDINDTSTAASTQFEILARDFYEDDVAISDLQIARIIEKKSDKTRNWGDMFLKNSLYVVPNPSLEFFGKSPSLYTYLEFYNAEKYSPDGVIFNYRIMDAARREIITIPKNVMPISNAQVETNKIMLDVLPSGVYYLEIIAEFKKTNFTDTLSVSKRFYVYNPDMPPNLQTRFTENQRFEMSPFSTMSEERIHNEWEQARIIATPVEVEKFDQLTKLVAKQRFMFVFWEERDPDGSTPINERFVKFKEAIQYATTYFSFGGRENGWKTDRGRALLKYGFPDDIERQAQKGKNHAYEEWFYGDVQGGAYFYFVDESGFGNFLLVHSTALGEVYNPNWYNEHVTGTKIQPGGGY